MYNVPVWKLIGLQTQGDKIRMYCRHSAAERYLCAKDPGSDPINLGFTWFKMDLQRSYLTSGTDYVLQNETGYPYQCITINQSGYDKWAAIRGCLPEHDWHGAAFFRSLSELG